MKIIFLGLMSLFYCACSSVNALEKTRTPSSYEGYYSSVEEITADSKISLVDALVKARTKCDSKLLDNQHYNAHDVTGYSKSLQDGRHMVSILCMIIAK
jgi:hypothetical protein